MLWEQRVLGSGGVILHFPGCFPEEAQSPSWRRGSTCTRTWCKIPVLQCCRLGFLRVRGFQALSWEVELPPELPGASRSVASASCPHGKDRAAWPRLQHPLLRSQTALQPPWECREGKRSHAPGGKSSLQAAPCTGCWCCSCQGLCGPALRAPSCRAFSSQQLGATKGEMWLQPGTALWPLRTSLAP